MVYLIDKQIPIGQVAKIFQTGQAVLIERVLQVGQVGRCRIDKVFRIDKAVLISQDLLIDKAGLIDKALLINWGSRIGRVFQIDKAGLIDREILIGPVRNLIIELPLE